MAMLESVRIERVLELHVPLSVDSLWLVRIAANKVLNASVTGAVEVSEGDI